MSVNYTQDVRGKFGGYVGQIVPHATPKIQQNNDPATAQFKQYVPAGYLKCDGSVVSAQKYAALASIIGVGSGGRFYKAGTIIRDADEDANDAGQIQLPDLGSKVIIASPNSVGQYTSTTNESTGANRVGPAVEIISNEGQTQLVCEFLGSFTGKPIQTNYNFNSSPKFNFNRISSSTILDIENFQGHAHNASTNVLNYTAQHQVGGDGKDGGEFGANSGAGNTFEDSPLNTNLLSQHSHKVGKPLQVEHSFQYQHDNFPIPADGVFSTLDLDIEDVTQLDNLSSPFIVITYLIKF
jgi:hypothetical protein